MDQPADVGFSERRAQQRLYDARADLELDRLQRPRSDLFSERRRQRNRPLRGELRGGEAPQQRASEVREARIGADQIDRTLNAPGPDHVCLLLEHRQRGLHARHAPHLPQQPFVESAGAPGVELELGVADELAVELRYRAGKAGAGDLRGEQQRHADGDPDDREALLHEHRPRTQPRTVEPEDVREAHPRHLTPSSGSEEVGTSTCSGRYSSIRPSRSSCT